MNGASMELILMHLPRSVQLRIRTISTQALLFTLEMISMRSSLKTLKLLAQPLCKQLVLLASSCQKLIKKLKFHLSKGLLYILEKYLYWLLLGSLASMVLVLWRLMVDLYIQEAHRMLAKTVKEPHILEKEEHVMEILKI